MAKILIIDDDPTIIHMMKENFEAEGLNVVTGFDGQMAINLARTQHPDLLVMDVNMPMTNGLKALAFLRESAETRLIPVILLTGEVSAHVYPALESQQRVAFLKKPIDLESLNEMVRHFLAKYPTK